MSFRHRLARAEAAATARKGAPAGIEVDAAEAAFWLKAVVWAEAAPSPPAADLVPRRLPRAIPARVPARRGRLPGPATPPGGAPPAGRPGAGVPGRAGRV